jgi:4-hydroxy-tetrahydrodipicolinate reductase
MNIGLIGYGKMGREIEKVAIERNHKISIIIDMDSKAKLMNENLSACNIIIEFTTPESAVENIELCWKANLPVVCGSTGWYSKLNYITEYAIKNGKSLFYAPNFSLGMNVLLEINRRLSALLLPHSYQPSIEETHHLQKLDSPSGSAIALSESIIENSAGKFIGWENNKFGNEAIIPIISHRIDEVPGIHKINYVSTVDRVSIEHEAFSRRGLAQGAVIAAEFLIGKSGVFSMKDLLQNF